MDMLFLHIVDNVMSIVEYFHDQTLKIYKTA